MRLPPNVGDAHNGLFTILELRDPTRRPHRRAQPQTPTTLTCTTSEAALMWLDGGRPISALLVDGTHCDLDRDLIGRFTRAGCAVIVRGDERIDWLALGATSVLRAGATLERSPTLYLDPQRHPPAPLIAVTGPGGTGASTLAIGLAQTGLVRTSRTPTGTARTLLADFRLHAELAALHGLTHPTPGVLALVDRFRTGHPSDAELRAMTVPLPDRRYDLLAGLPYAAAWGALRPLAFAAALTALRAAYEGVVADIDPDLEGEDDGGSIDVEERNVMARTVCTHADVVFVVGRRGLKGQHALSRVVGGLLAFGVPDDRVVAIEEPTGPESVLGALDRIMAEAGASPRRPAAFPTGSEPPDRP